jgi:hypothetical protein
MKCALSIHKRLSLCIYRRKVQRRFKVKPSLSGAFFFLFVFVWSKAYITQEKTASNIVLIKKPEIKREFNVLYMKVFIFFVSGIKFWTRFLNNS